MSPRNPRPPRPPRAEAPKPAGPLRINQYLARCGLGSRRAVEQLILASQIKLNGEIVTDLGRQIDENVDRVEVEGRLVRPPRHFEYLMLNKPRGYDVTRGGRHHHRRAHDLLPDSTHPSVQAVGRLDRNSTGLLLFTNDGDLAFRLMHPKYQCEKVYEVEVDGEADALRLGQFLTGIELDDGPAKAERVERLDPLEPGGPDRLRIIIQMGRNRIVRRMCEAVGLPVISLNRTRIGPLILGELRRGKSRSLTDAEVHRLKLEAGLVEGEGRPAKGELPQDNKPVDSRTQAPRGRAIAKPAAKPRGEVGKRAPRSRYDVPAETPAPRGSRGGFDRKPSGPTRSAARRPAPAPRDEAPERPARPASPAVDPRTRRKPSRLPDGWVRVKDSDRRVPRDAQSDDSPPHDAPPPRATYPRSAEPRGQQSRAPQSRGRDERPDRPDRPARPDRPYEPRPRPSGPHDRGGPPPRDTYPRGPQSHGPQGRAPQSRGRNERPDRPYEQRPDRPARPDRPYESRPRPSGPPSRDAYPRGPQGRSHEGRGPDDRRPQDRRPDDRRPENRRPEGYGPPSRGPQGRPPQNRGPASRADQYGGAQSRDRQTRDGQARDFQPRGPREGYSARGPQGSRPPQRPGQRPGPRPPQGERNDDAPRRFDGPRGGQRPEGRPPRPESRPNTGGRPPHTGGRPQGPGGRPSGPRRRPNGGR